MNKPLIRYQNLFTNIPMAANPPMIADTMSVPVAGSRYAKVGDTDADAGAVTNVVATTTRAIVIDRLTDYLPI